MPSENFFFSRNQIERERERALKEMYYVIAREETCLILGENQKTRMTLYELPEINLLGSPRWRKKKLKTINAFFVGGNTSLITTLPVNTIPKKALYFFHNPLTLVSVTKQSNVNESKI